MKFSFLPGEVRFYDYFERATSNLMDAAKLQQELLELSADVEQKTAQITETEHRGDFIIHEVMDLLPRTLLTPIDNEEIQNLVTAIDDALDSIEETASNILIYDVQEIREPARKFARLISEATRELHAAMGGLRDKKNFKEVHEHIVEINTIENSADRLLRDSMRELVSSSRDNTFELLRWKEIYELLEETTDRIEDAGDVLQRVIIANA
jgi:predicted phosphate transport protein (TIGR00153 family)